MLIPQYAVYLPSGRKGGGWDVKVDDYGNPTDGIRFINGVDGMCEWCSGGGITNIFINKLVSFFEYTYTEGELQLEYMV